MKKSELLRRAKDWLPISRYVCCSIKEAANQAGGYEDNTDLNETVYDLTDWIQNDLLEGWVSYNQWLEYEKEIPLYVQMQQPEKLLLTRKKWVDWMIKYWEAKGE